MPTEAVHSFSRAKFLKLRPVGSRRRHTRFRALFEKAKSSQFDFTGHHSLPYEAVNSPSELASQATNMTLRIGRPDNLVSARYVRPASVGLEFADGLSGTWTFDDLDLDMSRMKLATISASKTGADLEVTSKYSETVQIDSAALRATIDPEYAAELERSSLAIRGPLATS